MAVENDLVLIYFEDNPLVFARVERIEADVKPGWYHVTLLMLQVPLQTVTWILKDAYINGDTFTMNGKDMRLEKIKAPVEPPAQPADEKSGETGKAHGTKVIAFSDLKKE